MSDALFEGLEARLFLSNTPTTANPENEPSSDAAVVAARHEKPAKLDSHTDTRDIFGKDNRTRVRDTWHHPYAAVGRLDGWWDDGSGLSCTGAVVGRYHVLTAAHCVYTAKNGTADEVEFTSGLNDRQKPFGTVKSTRVRIDANYPDGESSADDYALITLASPLGDRTGWFGYGAYGTSSFKGMAVRTAGYPGDLSGGDAMYEQRGKVSYANTYKIVGKLDVAQGQSGSPVYRKDNTIVGVLSASSSQYTYATRITARRFQRIETWIDKDETKLAARATPRANPIPAASFSTQTIGSGEREKSSLFQGVEDVLS